MPYTEKTLQEIYRGATKVDEDRKFISQCIVLIKGFLEKEIGERIDYVCFPFSLGSNFAKFSFYYSPTWIIQIFESGKEVRRIESHFLGPNQLQEVRSLMPAVFNAVAEKHPEFIEYIAVFQQYGNGK